MHNLIKQYIILSPQYELLDMTNQTRLWALLFENQNIHHVYFYNINKFITSNIVSYTYAVVPYKLVMQSTSKEISTGGNFY